ncbi:M1 family metallopeptidase [Pendulispora rubella]|uniref:Aminopeptidase n=1 Tax=Pendulispora rubella TaxID=2741070 RepID=A0ABZ2KVY8_9BACT
MQKTEISAACVIALSAWVMGGCQAHEGSASATATAATPPQTTEASAKGRASAAPSPPALRLPESIRPVNYDAALTVVPTEARFDGHISIALDVQTPSNVVWLNAAKLDVRTATVNGAPAKVVPGGTNFIGIQTEQPLAAGRATLVIDYSGEISKRDGAGLFAQKEGEDWYAFTQFESIDARRVFPSFDEPSFKVPWKLRLKVKRDQLALSNTPAVSEKIEGDYKVVQFGETKPLPSYLVAFAVGPFDVVDAGKAGKNSTQVRIVVPRGRSAEARYAKAESGAVLNKLEEYFGIPYPYEKLDCIDVPTFGGAMENPGLVTFDQHLILSVPEKETIHFRRAYTDVAAHEFAHQWFGDLVTTRWWDDIWLNEAFATWTTNRILEDWKTDWHKETERVADTMRAMRDDALVSARRIRQPIESNDDIVTAFDSITYQKGAAVIDMFEHAVGREAFRAGVKRYLTKYSHKTATADDFLAAVFEGENAKVADAFKTFLDQPGVPLVKASLQCDAGKAPKLSLSQERYFPVGSDGKGSQKWQIPVCARYPGANGKTATSCTTLKEAQGELPLGEAKSCPAWVNANADAHGYYRVAYKGELLSKLLAGKAGDTRLTRAEKVALLGDMAALVRTNELSYADALAAAAKLSSDPVKDVAMASIELVGGLRRADLVSEGLRPKYARFVRDTFGARAKKLGFAPHPGEDEDARLTRPALLSLVADQGEDAALRAEAKTLALRWLSEREKAKVDPEVVETVLSLAAQNGDRAMFDRMLSEARKSTSRFDRNLILRAMGHFRDSELLRSALGALLMDEFDVRDAVRMLRGSQATLATREVVYTFVKQNYDALAKRLPGEPGMPSIAAGLPFWVGGSFCDDGHAADVQAFFGDRSTKYTGGPRDLAQAVEGVKLCSAYRSLQEPNVSAFLQKRAP